MQTNSIQFSLTVLTTFPLRGDTDGDCHVDIFDLSRVAAVFGNLVGPGVNPHTDLNLDGRISIADTVEVAANMGKSCT